MSEVRVPLVSMNTESPTNSTRPMLKYILAAIAVLAVINVVFMVVLLVQVHDARSQVSSLMKYRESLETVGSALESISPYVPRATKMLDTLAQVSGGSWVRHMFMIEFLLKTFGGRMETNIPDVLNRALRTDFSTLAFQAHDVADYASNRFFQLVQQDPTDRFGSGEAYNVSLQAGSVLSKFVLLRPVVDPATAPPAAQKSDDEVLNFLNNMGTYVAAQLDTTSWKKLAGTCNELVSEAMTIDWAGTWGDGNTWNYTAKVQDVLSGIGAYCNVLQ